MGPPPIERTLKTDLESVLMVLNNQYSNTSTFEVHKYLYVNFACSRALEVLVRIFGTCASYTRALQIAYYT